MPAEQGDDLDALLRCVERPAVPLDVGNVDQSLDDGRARCGRSDPGVLHRLAKLAVADVLAGGLHRGEERRVREAPRRLGLLAKGRDLDRVDGFPEGQNRERLVAARVVVVGTGRCRLRPVDRLPARFEQNSAARPEHVRLHGGLDPGALEDGLRVEDRQKATGDEVEDLDLVLLHPLELVLGAGGDDRVVVLDLLVVDHSSERELLEPVTYAALFA